TRYRILFESKKRATMKLDDIVPVHRLGIPFVHLYCKALMCRRNCSSRNDSAVGSFGYGKLFATSAGKNLGAWQRNRRTITRGSGETRQRNCHDRGAKP